MGSPPDRKYSPADREPEGERARPADRARHFAGLTERELFGEGLCEPPEIELQLDHDGEAHEARYSIEPFTWSTAPTPDLYALSSTCTDALRATNGMIAQAVGAGCTAEDEQAHFPSNGACRACLAIDGDHSRCVAAAQCKEQMTRELGIRAPTGTNCYDVLVSEVLTCAPNHVGSLFYLVDELGEDNRAPEPFDPDRYQQFCWWTWSIAAQAPVARCFALSGQIHPTSADVLTGRVVYIRRPGETSTPYADRWLMASSADVEGMHFDWGGYVRSHNPPRVELYPILTLGSTGLPDPKIPGGHVPQIFGTPTLGDPDWDGCAWPDIFYPDEMANFDSVAPHVYTFSSQTYRFGKDPNTDLRVVLATNRRRGFCSPSP